MDNRVTQHSPAAHPTQEYDVTHPRRGPGRPTKLTPDMQGRLITLLGNGYSAAEAAREVNLSPSTISLWLRNRPAFSAAVDRARLDPPALPAPQPRAAATTAALAAPAALANLAPAPVPGMLREIIRQHPDGVIEIERHYADAAPTEPPAAPQAAAENTSRANDHQEILAALQRIHPRSIARVQLDYLTGHRDRTLQALRALETLHLVERQVHGKQTRWRATAGPSH
ncbi:helix-turn-helix domain-containing protein [Nonomuraea sp. NPDC050202]|uniref:helix-turn-helix domain-containing protein n=1 Tax=Nonomuraea sp. NPDC050202 TaxID=3155035 RepID=UPI0033EAD923